MTNTLGDASGPGAREPSPPVSALRASPPIARSWRSLPRDGDFSNDLEALKLLDHDRDCFPEGTPVKISLAPRVLYISWPNDDYRPDDGSDPYHCVSIWLAEGNIVAQAIEARRAETGTGSVHESDHE